LPPSYDSFFTESVSPSPKKIISGCSIYRWSDFS
jgi:hypothetical protein